MWSAMEREKLRRTQELLNMSGQYPDYGYSSSYTPTYSNVQYQPQAAPSQDGGLGSLGSLGNLASLGQSGYGMLGGQTAGGGMAAGGTEAAGGASSAAGGSSSGMMGSLGPIGAIAAAVMMSKGMEADQGNSPMGKVMGSLNAPSAAQIMEDPKTGVTTAFGVPFLNGFIRNDESANARPEWESLFGGGS